MATGRLLLILSLCGCAKEESLPPLPPDEVTSIVTYHDIKQIKIYNECVRFLYIEDKEVKQFGYSRFSIKIDSPTPYAIETTTKVWSNKYSRLDKKIHQEYQKIFTVVI